MASLPDRHLRSTRKLTAGGLIQFEDTVQRRTTELRNIKHDIDGVIAQYEDSSDPHLRLTLTSLAHKYDAACHEYENFLKASRTAASLREEASHRLIAASVRAKISSVLMEIDAKFGKQDIKPVLADSDLLTKAKSPSKSLKKLSSVWSSRSMSSTVIRQQSAKIGIAMAELQFAEEEAELIRKQASIEAEKTILKKKRALAEAQTTLEAMELALDNESVAEVESQPNDRVLDYVLEQSDLASSRESEELPQAESTPRNAGGHVRHTEINPMADISRYLAKRDLISSRLAVFDDNPMNYYAWKVSFKNIMTDLQVTPLECLDLMVKWLGPESQRQAKSIRAANIANPQTAIDLIWERLDSRYGSPEIIEDSLQSRLAKLPRLTSNSRKEYFDLLDLATEILAVKKEDSNRTLFSYFDSSHGVNKLVCKLPHNYQEKWSGEVSKFKQRNQGHYPSFEFFVSFLKNLARMKNDPGLVYETSTSTKPPVGSGGHKTYGPGRGDSRNVIHTRKTEVNRETHKEKDGYLCPLHKTKHKLNDCLAFRQKPVDERKKFLFSNGICFKCCGPVKHHAKDCKTDVKCNLCNMSTHPTALHEQQEVISACTQVCKTTNGKSKSCAKILSVKVYPEGHQDESRLIYAVIDDQSDHSLATPTFLDSFQDNSPVYDYCIISCAGRKMTSGRRGTGYIVESLDGSTVLKLPTLVECSDIPNNRDEIPSPEVALQYQYLHDIAPFILPVNENVEIELLIGRDLIMAHHVLDQRISVDHSPYAQRLPLGWVILGPVCLGNAHLTDSVNVKKTFILPNGRPSLLEPCESKLSLKEDPFLRTNQDEKLGLSIEDKAFLQIMDSGFKKDTDGHWTAPLPFREDRPRLPDNRDHALRRAKTLDLGLLRNPLKREHVQEFMRKIFDRGHAELAPHVPAGNERWYLPMFGVYHPKKPEAIRMVFDSSAKHEGVALNDILLKGPDSSNSLQGILMRFRKEKIAITADVEQMFHNFRVYEPHRDYLRFIWHEENNVEKPLTDYRMTVHVFGNSPSPAVATYGLRKSVANADDDVRSFVNRNFYVDDGLISCPSETEAVNLFKRTQESLMSGGHLRLHKVASNSKAVLQMCDSDDLAKDLKDLDLGQDTLPVQRSLGVSWDIESDNIVFRVSTDQRPFTRRGVLSVINSLYDPVGFTAPVTLQGKLLLREMMSSFSGPLDWDEPLQPTFQKRWKDWVISLQQLELLKIPRMYCKLSITFSSKCEVHICSDASKEAIAAVAYLKVFTENGSHDLGFLLGKGKVAPVHGHTIPRLELCAAVMAVNLAEIISEQMDIDREAFHFYTDSRIVLGYISNDSRRFHVYVANRVGRIRSFSKPCQWNHIPTDCNPADLATREFHASDLPYSMWIHGPSFLKEDHVSDEDSENRSEGFPLIDAEEDKEVKKEDVMCMKTTVEQTLDWERFSRFSSWKHLVRAVMNVKRLARKYKKSKTEVSVSEAEIVIIRKVQSMIFPEEIAAIMEGRSPPQNSTLLPLKPILDEHGVLRVGGRIQRMRGKKQNDYTKAITCHPKIIPKGHQIALLLVRHYHASIHHQGRHLTEGAIRSAGYWIIGGKRLVSTVIRDCVTCKKLRGQTGWCQMADLPIDRMEPGPPFTFVGIDTFGPWPIVFRRTRGGQSNQNRWAIMFTCLVSRAVHVELVEELSSSSFINALRRFVAVRGPVKQYRSDRGTNFVGAAKELNIDAHFVESGEVGQYLAENGASWLFNPPHASHFGGAWERMIGACRKILDAMLLQNKHDLTHEVLSTLMLEVCAILNARPLVPVSSDPEEPEVLSPSLLLTQKPSSWDPQLPEFELKDALKSQWKFVQHLADEFWTRWSSDYLQNLQKRQKWESGGVTFSVGDIVLMKESDLSRNRWPLGIIEETFPSDDSFVRKVKVVVIRDGKRTPYVRPISQLIHLIEVK